MADGSRLLTRATDAFVDRASIDWNALLSRVRASPERRFFENLRELAALRDEHRPAGLPTTRRAASVAAWAIVAVASVQTVFVLGLLAAAVAAGESIAGRSAQLVLACSFAAASLPLATIAVRDTRGLFLLATFITASGVFSTSAATALPVEWSAAINPLMAGPSAEAFIPACLWEFALDFPRVPQFTAFDQIARRAARASWLAGGLLFSVNLAGSADLLRGTPFELLLRDDSSHLFWALFSVMSAPAPLAILARARRAPLVERRKVARLALAVGGGLTPFLSFLLLETLAPAVYSWFSVSTSLVRASLYAVLVAALAAAPVLGTAAVIRDRPFDFQGVLRRMSRYALAKRALTWMIAAPVMTLVASVFVTPHSRIGDALRDGQARLLLSCAAGGSLLLLMRGRLLNALDRRVSGRAAPDGERLGRALERISLARGLRETVEILAREWRLGLGVQAARILIPAEDGTFVDWSRQLQPLPSHGGLATLLRETTMPLDLAPDGSLLNLLPHADRDWTAAHGVELAVPLKRHDGSLAAIVACGPKRGGFPFAPADRWFAAALAAASAAAWADDRFSGSEGENASSLTGAPVGRRSHPASDQGEAAVECPRCGLVADRPPLPCDCGHDAVLAVLPRHVGEKFVVERRLGAGGMGVVYLARDTTLDREVALKTLPELRQETVRRLRAEARAMATLNHEALATLYGLEVWRRAPVLVVEYFPNGTLAQRLGASGPLPPLEAAALGLRLAGALAYMHALGMLHRDVKPTNIAFGADGEAKLMDFGLACTDPSAGRVAGTPAYLAPEAAGGAPPAAQFDLWALSVVILEAATGVRSLAPENLNAAELDALPQLRAVLARALAKSPGHRFRTALEFKTALQAVVGRAR